MQFKVVDQVNLISADMLGAELIGRAVEVFGEPANGADIDMCGSLGVIPALEFLEHPFSKLGHRDLLVTHTIRLGFAAASVAYAQRPQRKRLSSNGIIGK